MRGTNNIGKRVPMSMTVRNLDEEREQGPYASSASSPHASSASLRLGWLLRLFRSDFFDAWMAVTYLYRYRNSRGVHDYICNELYHLPDVDLEAYLPQICNLLVYHARDSVALEQFVMDKCAQSMHFALQVYWFLQAAVEDSVRTGDKKAEGVCRLLRTRCETAAVNGSFHRGMSSATHEERILDATLYASYDTTKGEISTKDVIPEVEGLSITTSLSSSLFPARPASRKMNRSVAELKEGRTGESRPKEKAFGQAHSTAPSRKHRSQCETPLPELGQSTNKLVEHDGISSQEYDDEGEQRPSEALALIIGQGGIDGSPHSSATNGEREDEDCEEKGPSHGNLQSDQGDCQLRDGPNASLEEECSNRNIGHRAQSSLSDSDVNDIYQRGREKGLGDHSVAGVSEAELYASKCSPLNHGTLLSMKHERFEYFNDTLGVMGAFVNLSLALRDVLRDKRQAHVQHGLSKINDRLSHRMIGKPFGGTSENAKHASLVPEEIAKMGERAILHSIHLPLSRARSPALRILRISTEETVILTSRTRAPFMLYIEVLPTSMSCSSPFIFCHSALHIMDQHEALPEAKLAGKSPPLSFSQNMLKRSADISEAVPPATVTGKERTPLERLRDNVRVAIYGTQEASAFSENRLGRDEYPDRMTKKARHAALLAVYGELWSWKEERILSQSPYRALRGRKLTSFIVKAGDDLRQEQLAVQLISQFKWIFDKEEVDIFLRPFTVVCVSSDSGLVEVIPDAVSIHSLKKRTPNFTSLLDYFVRSYGPKSSKSFRIAQRKFIRSMAGYSLVTYFLQIKDRHNGNIMLDAEGNIIHIDFGFMLANSPGSIKFENVPFKLTEEYVQVICGMFDVAVSNNIANTSEGWLYYQELIVLGFLAARKHYEKVITLVEIMMEGTSMPCMAGGKTVRLNLRHRFNLGVPEDACISNVLALIEESRNSWRSVSYDKFQFYTNGYL